MHCTFLQGTCEGEINECQNEGRMIWDPVKPFSCLCKEGYEGELCEKSMYFKDSAYDMKFCPTFS